MGIGRDVDWKGWIRTGIGMDVDWEGRRMEGLDPHGDWKERIQTLLLEGTSIGRDVIAGRQLEGLEWKSI